MSADNFVAEEGGVRQPSADVSQTPSPVGASEDQAAADLGAAGSEQNASGQVRQDPTTAQPHTEPKRRPFFRRKSVLIGTGGALGSIAAAVLAAFAWLSPKSPPPLPPDIEITAVGVDRLQDVDVVTANAGIEFIPSKEKESVIDIALQNHGGTPALIRSIDVNFDYAQELQNCNPGRGPVKVTGKYDILVPVELNSQQFSVHHDNVLFQLPPNAFDRLAVTIGPERTVSGDSPWLYSATVTLNLDPGSSQRTIQTSRVSFLSPASDVKSDLGQYSQPFPLAESQSCFQRNLDEVTRVAALGGASSPLLTYALGEYRKDIDMLSGSSVDFNSPAAHHGANPYRCNDTGITADDPCSFHWVDIEHTAGPVTPGQRWEACHWDDNKQEGQRYC